MADLALRRDYPWLSRGSPIVVAAPMMRITMARLSVAVSKAGGMGFLAAGFDLSDLSKNLSEAAELVKTANIPTCDGVLPIGVGFQNWGADLDTALEALGEHPVAAVWFFGPKHLSDLVSWTRRIRDASEGRTKIWVQVGSVAEALEVARTSGPDVLVIQGADSGGHGLAQRAGIMTLLPEVADCLAREGFRIPLIAAGGILDTRGAAAALSLGADGLCLGTRFLACKEAVIAGGYQKEILRAGDGGTSTVATTVYDTIRGIDGWPSCYTGRAVSNKSYRDHLAGMDKIENKGLYKEAMRQGDQGWGPDGRMTTYAGTGVGLVKEVKSAKDIVQEIQEGAVGVLQKRVSKL